jgi:hypothetical protein
MDSGERVRHSFVLVIWSEGPIGDDGSVVWRGTITDADTNERRAFQTIDGAVAFITPYLEAMGVTVTARTGVRDRVRHWSERIVGSNPRTDPKDEA